MKSMSCDVLFFVLFLFYFCLVCLDLFCFVLFLFFWCVLFDVVFVVFYFVCV
jgi:hypothetical protein